MELSNSDFEKYSKLMRQVLENSVNIRGLVLHHFCELDGFVIDIINKLLKMDFTHNKFNNDDKRRLFKDCLEIFKNYYKKDYDYIIPIYDDLTDHRDRLAHWATDITFLGLDEFQRTANIRLIRTRYSTIVEMRNYDEQKSKRLIERIESLRKVLFEIHEVVSPRINK